MINQFLNASGCWASDESQIEQLYHSNLGAIVIKTCTLLPKEGNPEPTYYTPGNNIHINSKGLPNKGYEYYKNLYHKFSDNKPFILSVSWENKENTCQLLKDYDSFVKKTELVELNLSCPNLNHLIPSYHPLLLNEILFSIKNLHLKNIKFSIKLSPYLDHTLCNNIIDIINLNHDIIQYIVLSNSIPNCTIFHNHHFVLSKKYGGLSGKLNKFISLSNVIYFRDRLDDNIKIIGCGGIETIEDVNDYLTNGADFVQLASCFYDETTNLLNINNINKLIKNYSNLILNE